ncbi:hypothetical protein [Stieleria varia]|uniref:Uncharacterized protein n=1 Tax=Stieleria varia TaxID=2528005 RepID=A0A5C5ZSR9_9BACT|nr:hypothetical protein [Stieleria varia]TWT89263.1 hypothetical protein Pla52n_68600 [Stieleria varia]
MSKKKSSLDEAAEQLELRSQSISKGRSGSDSVVELSFCLDEDIVGVYPQAAPPKANGDFQDDGYLYFDRFPEPAGNPIELRLQSGAEWTDVLSASIKYFCLLVNSTALEVFKRFDLGNVKYYEAAVLGKKKEKRDYTYIFICNHVTLDDVDFPRTECFLVDMLSDPLGEIAVVDKADYLAKVQQANEGSLPDSEPFSRIAMGKVQLLPGHAPSADIFGMSQLDTKTYVSTPLRDALLKAGVSGLQFASNTRLFL